MKTYIRDAGNGLKYKVYVPEYIKNGKPTPFTLDSAKVLDHAKFDAHANRPDYKNEDSTKS